LWKTGEGHGGELAEFLGGWQGVGCPLLSREKRRKGSARSNESRKTREGDQRAFRGSINRERRQGKGLLLRLEDMGEPRDRDTWGGLKEGQTLKGGQDRCVKGKDLKEKPRSIIFYKVESRTMGASKGGNHSRRDSRTIFGKKKGVPRGLKKTFPGRFHVSGLRESERLVTEVMVGNGEVPPPEPPVL